MKKAIILIALLLAAMTLASCGGGGQTTAPTASAPAQTTEEQIPTLVEIDDVEGVPSGDYIQGKEIFRIDKASKTLKVYDFDMDYNKYKNGDGTLLAECAIGFFRAAGVFDRIMFDRDGTGYSIYASSGKIYLSKSGDGTSVSSTITPFPTDLREPVYGSFVSGKLTQYKLDAEGKRMIKDDGSYEKEEFFLFLDLTETSVRLYVGHDDSGHDPEPILSAENYVLSYNSSGIAVRVPHAEGSNYALRLTFKDDAIHFVNDSERDGDYSGSGTFIIINE